MKFYALTFALLLPLALGRICLKDSRVHYLKRGTTYVSRSTWCDYSCFFASHSRKIDSSYTAQTCEIAYRTELRSDCCDGYAKDSRGECQPVCEGGCLNGACVEPNRCDCGKGFQLHGNRCLPVCESPCIRGVCSSPGKCTCFPGYTNQTSTECVPVCYNRCVNGKCIAPNTCECNYGFEKSPISNHQCVPTCDPEIADCGYGSCVEPNRCRCVDGFVFRGTRCIPQCDPACINGYCTNTNTCTCKEGFSRSSAEPNVCVPICESGCPNGACVAPNTCQCTLGYNVTSADPNLCEPSCDPTYIDIRNGQCIAPNVLRCNEEFLLESSLQSGLMQCRSIAGNDQEVSTTELPTTEPPTTI